MSGCRGILGMKRDPKHQILFKFNGENWPSSDSEDTDYEPGQELSCRDSDDSLSSDLNDEAPSSSRRTCQRAGGSSNSNNAHSVQKLSRKRRRPQKSSKSKSIKLAETSPLNTRATGVAKADKALNGSKSGAVPNTPVGRLPMELWLKIFHFVVRRHGALPFLCRAARVCREWYDLARVASLWHKVDLSYGWIKSTDQTLKWLAQNNLSECKEINLSGWKNVTNEAFKKLCESCHDLEAVNLSHCRKLTSVSVSALASSCPKLRQLDLSFSSVDTMSVKSLKFLVDKVGSRLRELTLAGNLLTGFNVVLNAIMLKCQHLDTLDLSNCGFTTGYLVVNVEKLQQSCPSLRVLRLANCRVRSSQDSVHCQGVGFVKLQQLSCAMPVYMRDDPSITDRGPTDSLLVRLLHKAENVRLLDLRGCTNFNPTKSFLSESSPITDLEELYLSRSSITRYVDCLAPALQRWSHSLLVLDLAWTSPPAQDLELALRALTLIPTCPLTTLSLAGSPATLSSVLLALEKLPQLESLDLTSCRSLPRGIKCLHTGPTQLSKLRASLQGDNSGSDTDSY
ncbi:F-box/LRR-repeat protein 6-like isoform X2 [Babylonia areolata]|uniref:F-box/LRR-repeat protein 6-like isoform X2 n=1 Tax=Babylonia areolata TaxID=304850 RepID=UPI003FD436BB